MFPQALSLIIRELLREILVPEKKKLLITQEKKKHGKDGGG